MTDKSRKKDEVLPRTGENAAVTPNNSDETETVERTHSTRAIESREEEMRTQPWKPVSMLPSPNPRDGLDFRYVRAGSRGEEDNINVSQALREGWTPVKASDYPELQVLSDRGSRWPDNVLVGNLLLCARDSAIGDRIKEYGAKETQGQMQAIDQQLFKDNDARMPLSAPERKTSIKFGGGSGE